MIYSLSALCNTKKIPFQYFMPRKHCWKQITDIITITLEIVCLNHFQRPANFCHYNIKSLSNTEAICWVVIVFEVIVALVECHCSWVDKDGISMRTTSVLVSFDIKVTSFNKWYPSLRFLPFLWIFKAISPALEISYLYINMNISLQIQTFLKGNHYMHDLLTKFLRTLPFMAIQYPITSLWIKLTKENRISVSKIKLRRNWQSITVAINTSH